MSLVTILSAMYFSASASVPFSKPDIYTPPKKPQTLEQRIHKPKIKPVDDLEEFVKKFPVFEDNPILSINMEYTLKDTPTKHFIVNLYNTKIENPQRIIPNKDKLYQLINLSTLYDVMTIAESDIGGNPIGKPRIYILFTGSEADIVYDHFDTNLTMNPDGNADLGVIMTEFNNREDALNNSIKLFLSGESLLLKVLK